MPFGLTAAPSTFQRTMDVILAGLKWTACLVYIDDVVVYANSMQEHLERLDQVLACIEKAKLKIKLSKCRFAEERLQVLGHVVDKQGIAPDPDKLRAVAEFKSPNEEKTEKKNIKAI